MCTLTQYDLKNEIYYILKTIKLYIKLSILQQNDHIDFDPFQCNRLHAI